jgi:hypothetical protein
MSRAAERTVWNIYALADAKWIIQKPVVLLDFCWNALIVTVQVWCEKFPQTDLNLPDIAEYAIAATPGLAKSLSVSGKAKYTARKCREMYMAYWTKAENRDLPNEAHRGFWAAFESRCSELGKEGVLEVWLWEPSEDAETDGFAFKWRATALSGVLLTDILGYHPEVKAEVGIRMVEHMIRKSTLVI